MIPVKIQCGCGQKFAFDVEPVNGRMPQGVACPVCGADATAAANEIIARALAEEASPPRAPLSAQRQAVHHSASAQAPAQFPSSAAALNRVERQAAGKVLWISAAVMGALLSCVAAYYWWNPAGNRGDPGAAMEALDAGLPNTLAELNRYYSEPPDGANAALLFQEGFDVLQITPADRRSTDLPVLGSGVLPVLGNGLGPRMKQAMAAMERRNERAWEAFQKAAKLDRARYPVDLTRGFDAQLPHLTKLKEVAQLSELNAIVFADTKQPQPAADAVLTALATAQSLKDEPLLLSQLVRVACLGILKDCLERVVNSLALPSEAFERISASLAKAESEESAGTPFTRAYAGERANALAFFDLPKDRLDDKLKKMSAGIPSGTGGVSRDDFKGFTRNLKSQRAFAEETFNRSLVMRKQPFPDRLNVTNYFASRVAMAKDKRYQLCLTLLPALGNTAKKEAGGLAVLRVIQTAVALERFRAGDARGYPVSLDELTPTFLASAPKDPFDGAPLRYTRRGSGYELECTGADAAKPVAFRVIDAPVPAR